MRTTTSSPEFKQLFLIHNAEIHTLIFDDKKFSLVIIIINKSNVLIALCILSHTVTERRLAPTKRLKL